MCLILFVTALFIVEEWSNPFTLLIQVYQCNSAQGDGEK